MITKKYTFYQLTPLFFEAKVLKSVFLAVCPPREGGGEGLAAELRSQPAVVPLKGGSDDYGQDKGCVLQEIKIRVQP